VIAIGALLREAASLLTAAGIESPGLEARLLLAHTLGVDRNALLDRRQEIDPAAFQALLQRRLTHEPLAFITGFQGFWTLDLAVSPDTLIPRADSEALIMAARDHCAAAPPATILDLGTGTGCLLLAALVEFPDAQGVGIDLSPGAAALARRNAAMSGLGARAAFLCGSWASAITGRFDLILSNPPYIETADIAGLMPEVARFEPQRALDGGADGLDAYRVLTAALPDLLTPEGVAILELGAGQAEAVTSLAAGHGLRSVALVADLGGIPRALVLKPQKTFGSEVRSV
jgi:release factor glutamine methyltransferase